MNNFRIVDMANPYLQHDMIQTHTDLPEFPEYRTRLLLAFLKEKHPQDSELLALVTSLIQMGLDTHDLVTETNDQKEKSVARSRQLKVLAGDYFSSRFYYLLSQAGQIEMIKQLSSAICEVNRLKMNLYMRMKQLKMTGEEYIQHSVSIKSTLFLSFQRRMEEGSGRLWPEVLNAFTKCEVLAYELDLLYKPEKIQGSWAFWHILPSATKEEKKQLQADVPDPNKLISILAKYNVTGQLYDMFQEQADQLFNKISQIGASRLSDELKELVSHLFRKPLVTPRVLEER